MTSVAAIQSWFADLDSTMANLPTAIASSAPNGDFAAVLQSAQTLLDGPPVTSSTTTSSGQGASIQGTTGETSASSDTYGSVPSSTLLSSALSSAPTTAAPSTSTTAPTGKSVVAEAEQFLGVPYQWGGTSPQGFDCSGLVQYVYGKLGVELPRTSEEQVDVGTPVASLKDAQPGDLVFFAGSDGTDSDPGHVGIYIGNGEMIDAPYTGTDVQIQAVGDPVAIRRVLPDTTSATSTANNSTTAMLSSSQSTVPSSLVPLFDAAAKKYGIPATLLTAVAQQESGFNANAVSSAGAEGLMQIEPSTAASLGINPFNPAQAIDGAANLLSSYLTKFGSVSDALAAYNAGPGAVEQYGGVPPYAQTQNYVQSILANLNAASTSTSSVTTQTAGSDL